MRLTIKVFRTLRSATKGVASEHHHLLKKVDENFCSVLPLPVFTPSANSVQLQVGTAENFPLGTFRGQLLQTGSL